MNNRPNVELSISNMRYILYISQKVTCNWRNCWAETAIHCEPTILCNWITKFVSNLNEQYVWSVHRHEANEQCFFFSYRILRSCCHFFKPYAECLEHIVCAIQFVWNCWWVKSVYLFRVRVYIQLNIQF